MKTGRRLHRNGHNLGIVDWVDMNSNKQERDHSPQVLPSTMNKLIAAGLFEQADDGSYILTAKGRRYAEAGKIPNIESPIRA